MHAPNRPSFSPPWREFGFGGGAGGIIGIYSVSKFRANSSILRNLQSFRTFFCDGQIKEAHCKKKIMNLKGIPSTN